VETNLLGRVHAYVDYVHLCRQIHLSWLLNHQPKGPSQQARWTIPAEFLQVDSQMVDYVVDSSLNLQLHSICYVLDCLFLIEGEREIRWMSKPEEQLPSTVIEPSCRAVALADVPLS
jgi:hypothetical protein